MQISDAEQLRRFEQRTEDAFKSWKITDEDWRNRQKRKQYEEAAEDMFKKTDTDYCPWRLIPAEHKWYGRIEVIKTVVKEMERVLGKQAAESATADNDA